MKKVITYLVVFLIFTAVLCVSVSAESEGTSSSVSSIKIESYPIKTVYGAFEQFDNTGLSVSVVYNDGSGRLLLASEVSVSYQNDSCLRVGDEYVLLSYGGKSLRLPVTVNPISYDLDAALDGVSLVYNGKYQSYTQILPSIIGLDGIPLTVSAVGGGVSVGEYDVSIDFQTESRDYLTPESRVVKMIIEPAEAEIIWTALNFTYDGKSKAPVASYTDVTGKLVYPSVIGAATNAGRYTAKVSLNDPNYVFSSASADFEIKKADYDLSGVSWSAESFVYDGSKKSVTVSGLPKGVSVIGYEGDVALEAGKYIASATLNWDKSNYNDPAILNHSWEILPANYDISGFNFISSSYVYDGNVHYPTLEGKMPTGADGISLEYSFSAGACHVSDGRVSVIISFKTSSKNYNTPKNQYSSVVITPLGINVTWGSSNLIYNGDRQAPTAVADECVVKVSGGALTVGKYSATAESQNSDYYIINDKQDFTISKAENAWTVKPAFATCYEGREIKLTGESRFGEIIYTFFSDPDGKNKISMPSTPGRYYASMTVSETMNYSGLKSDIIGFEIVEISAVSFVASIDRQGLKAFERLTYNDITCSVINNDGSSEEIDPMLIKISYQNGDSLRKNDEHVRLRYENFVLTLPVEVGYADYDLTEIVWLGAVTTYTGKPQSPMLYGLPAGVRVTEYVGAEVTNAGSYKVRAIIDYDSDNYNEPTIPICDFVIEKKPISIPHIKAVYNGKPQSPTSSSLYKVSLEGTAKEAGIYSLSVTLADPENYILAETQSDRANGIFEILPATLSVSISDVRLHLFEKLSSANYSITSGKIIDGDLVNLSFYLDGKNILAVSQNPNYTLDVKPGRLVRLPYPTLSGGIWMLAALLGVILLIMLLVLMVRERHRLASAVAIARCRWHNRNFKISPPKDEERCEEVELSVPNIAAVTVEEEMAEEKIEVPESEFDAEKADMLITDSLAKSLIKKEGDVIYTEGTAKAVINIDALRESFLPGDKVDINSLKSKGIIQPDAGYIKLLAGGRLDKPLTVYANDFSLSAVKMIALCGGQAIKSVTLKGKPREEKD